MSHYPAASVFIKIKISVSTDAMTPNRNSKKSIGLSWTFSKKPNLNVDMIVNVSLRAPICKRLIIWKNVNILQIYVHWNVDRLFQKKIFSCILSNYAWTCRLNVRIAMSCIILKNLSIIIAWRLWKINCLWFEYSIFQTNSKLFLIRIEICMYLYVNLKI